MLALETNIPITDPRFYASSTLCPDSLIQETFRPATQSTEVVPLLVERIAVMREVGGILVSVRTIFFTLCTVTAAESRNIVSHRNLEARTPVFFPISL